MTNLPLVSDEIERPAPTGWMYVSWQSGQEVKELKLNRFHPDQLAYYRQHRNVSESVLFDLGAMNFYATRAVQAEQDLVAPLIDKCAEIVSPYLKSEGESGRIANAIIGELSVLRRFIARQRTTGDRIAEREPLYWWTESEVKIWKLAKTGKFY